MTDLSPGDRYVALGSSFAARPRPRPRSPGLSPRGAAAYHPNAAGMRAVADLLVDTLGRPPRPGDRPALRRLSASRVH
jgi:hypothetical protein